LPLCILLSLHAMSKLAVFLLLLSVNWCPLNAMRIDTAAVTDIQDADVEDRQREHNEEELKKTLGSGAEESTADSTSSSNQAREHNTEELTETLGSDAAESISNTSLARCPQWANGGLGVLTVGVKYLRSRTVNNTIAAMLPGDDKPGPFTQFLGSIVRSRMGVSSATYVAINAKIIEDASPLIIAGIGASHITMVPGPTATMEPGCGTPALCPNKNGMVLMEFAVCGASPAQAPLFKCCNVWGSKPETELGGWARAVGDWAFDAFAGINMGKNLVGGKIIDGLTNELPGQLMAGLQAAKIGNPNVVIWPKRLNPKLFPELAAAPQAEVTTPKPECPGPGSRC
jgi:hypothetical protein